MTKKQIKFMRKIIRVGFEAGVKWAESADKESRLFILSDIDIAGEELFKKLHLTAIDEPAAPKSCRTCIMTCGINPDQKHCLEFGKLYYIERPDFT